IVPIKAKLGNLGTARFLKVARYFVSKVGKELVNEKNGDEWAATRKRKGHCQRSDSLIYSFETPECVRRVYGMT
ncbi:unnamed protein product, partial [Hymenolepis diminuta]